MTVKLSYRELQRYNTGKLLKVLGNEVGIVYSNGEALFKVKVCTERDLTLDSQKTGENEATGMTVKKEGQNETGGHDSQSQPSVKPLQQMINRMQGHDSQSQKHKIANEATTLDSQGKPPWYDSTIHTTGDTVRMKVGNMVQVVTL